MQSLRPEQSAPKSLATTFLNWVRRVIAANPWYLNIFYLLLFGVFGAVAAFAFGTGVYALLVGLAFIFAPIALVAAIYAAAFLVDLVRKNPVIAANLLGITLFFVFIFALPIALPAAFALGVIALLGSILFSFYFWRKRQPPGSTLAEKLFFALALGVLIAATIALFFPFLGLLIAPGILGIAVMTGLIGLVPFVLFGMFNFGRAVYETLKTMSLRTLLIGMGLFLTAGAVIASLFAVGSIFALPVTLLIGGLFLLGSMIYTTFFSDKTWKERTLSDKASRVLLIGLSFAALAIGIAILVSPLGILGIGILGFAAIGSIFAVLPFIFWGLAELYNGRKAIWQAITKGFTSLLNAIRDFFIGIGKRVLSLLDRAWNVVKRAAIIVGKVIYFSVALAMPIGAFFLLATFLPTLPIWATVLIFAATFAAMAYIVSLLFNFGFSWKKPKLPPAVKGALILLMGISFAVAMFLFMPFLAVFLGATGVLVLGAIIALGPALIYGAIQLMDRIRKNAVVVFTLLGLVGFVAAFLLLPLVLPAAIAVAVALTVGAIFFILSFLFGLYIRTPPKPRLETLKNLSPIQIAVILLSLGVVAGLVVSLFLANILLIVGIAALVPLALGLVIGLTKAFSAVGSYIRKNQFAIVSGLCFVGALLGLALLPLAAFLSFLLPVLAVAWLISAVVRFNKQITTFFKAILRILMAIGRFVKENPILTSALLSVLLLILLVLFAPISALLALMLSIVFGLMLSSAVSKNTRVFWAVVLAAIVAIPLVYFGVWVGLTAIVFGTAAIALAAIVGFFMPTLVAWLRGKTVPGQVQEADEAAAGVELTAPVPVINSEVVPNMPAAGASATTGAAELAAVAEPELVVEATPSLLQPEPAVPLEATTAVPSEPIEATELVGVDLAETPPVAGAVVDPEMAVSMSAAGTVTAAELAVEATLSSQPEPVAVPSEPTIAAPLAVSLVSPEPVAATVAAPSWRATGAAVSTAEPVVTIVNPSTPVTAPASPTPEPIAPAAPAPAPVPQPQPTLVVQAPTRSPPLVKMIGILQKLPTWSRSSMQEQQERDRLDEIEAAIRKRQEEEARLREGGAGPSFAATPAGG